MRAFSIWFSALVISLSFGVASASADCATSCWDWYYECQRTCSQCNCSYDLELCLDGCQYTDTDGDGIVDSNDNCPDNPNANQADCDADGYGNVCDSLNGSFVPSGNRIGCASKEKYDYPWIYAAIEVTYNQRYVDVSACHSPDRWNHSRITQDCYGYCDGLEENICGGACWNKPGYQCNQAALCGSNLGSYFCQPDTI